MHGNTSEGFRVSVLIDGRETKVRVEAVYYFGYLQGHKVYIDGVKYPRQRGYVYTDMEYYPAVERAIAERV